jgi:uncharacterized protein (TIGR02271 family)
MPIIKDQLDNLIGSQGDVIGRGGEKIGGIGEIYLDDVTGEPEWVSVNTGLFGVSESFVPLQAARIEGNDIQVDYDKELVKDAPRVSAGGHLTPEEEQRLYDYYGLTVAQSTGYEAAEVGYDTGGNTVGYDTSGPTTDDAMTRSEERLNVGTRTQEAGRARLRKYVVTENVTQTVPVSREEVRVEREPITEENVGAAVSGPEISEEEHEVVLREERPVVEKEAVPVERVRLGTETVTEQETVSEDVRKEEIETDLGDDRTSR